MKRIIKCTVALLLAMFMCLASFVACSDKKDLGKTLMSIEDTTISVNLYMLYLSRLKGILCSSYSFGESAISDSFWDTVMSADGTTYNKYYSESILENTKTYLAALYEFDRRGLELPKATIDKIDERLETFINEDANGSKPAFNAILAEYGVNYDILREAYIIEEKIAYLKNDIFGADGSKIAKNLIDDYYKANYARFKQILYYTCDYVYITDENGDDIYYKKDGKIAYDTTATPKTDANGNNMRDANGDVIFVKTNSEGLTRVAYDTKNGTRRNKTDTDGSYIIAELEGAELQAVLAQASETYAKMKKDDYETFEKNMNSEESYPNGYYITKETDYDSPEVVEAIFEMEVGEVRAVKSQYGVHVIMKYELEDDGYDPSAHPENSDFFISTKNGNYVFLTDLINQLTSSYLTSNYKDKIIVDTTALEGVDIKRVAPNFYY